jgi:hypothetical protein
MSLEAQGPWPPVEFGFNVLHNELFDSIRACRKVTDEMVADAFSQQPNDTNILSGGNSGCIVMTSVNRRFVLKALRVGEAKVLSSLLPDFVEHVKTNPQTLIVCIVGMYEVRHEGKEKHYVVMENVLQGADELPMHEHYDLKGSAIDRRAIKGMVFVFGQKLNISSNLTFAGVEAQHACVRSNSMAGTCH